jgi:thiol-disulfide isomerase/thioredoxin
MNPCHLINVVDEASIGGTELKLFVSKEELDLNEFLTKHRNELEIDTIFNELIEKSTNLAKKKLEFIKDHPDSYYAFWLFRTDIAGTKRIALDTLMDVFNRFPEEFRQSPEGNEIIRVLYGAGLRKGIQAPPFDAVDINNSKVSLKAFQGKYLLLDFWASWCAPCIEEMPVVRHIHERVRNNRLVIVSISLDRNYEAFRKALEKNGMTWVQIFNDRELVNLYGSYAVPSVYLIDPNGIVIYSREEEVDIGLKALRNIIDSKILTE